MPWKDVIEFLWRNAIGTKDDKGNVIRTQDDFAAKYTVERETMNQWIRGKQVPKLGTMEEIIKGEGYKVSDCMDVPLILDENAQTDYGELVRNLKAIVASGDPDRIHGIKINLQDIAAAARSHQLSLNRKAAKSSSKPRGQVKNKEDTKAG